LHDETRLLGAENVHNADNEPPKVMRLLAIAQVHDTLCDDPTDTNRLAPPTGLPDPDDTTLQPLNAM